MTELILSHDIEAVLVEYLREKLDVTVATKRPENQTPEKNTEFITVRRIGGRRKDRVIDEVMVKVDCYHSSEQKAFTLANKAQAYLLQLRGKVGSAFISVVYETNGIIHYSHPLEQFLDTYSFTVTVVAKTTTGGQDT